jgi:hypothetical protein
MTTVKKNDAVEAAQENAVDIRQRTSAREFKRIAAEITESTEEQSVVSGWRQCPKKNIHLLSRAHKNLLTG